MEIDPKDIGAIDEGDEVYHSKDEAPTHGTEALTSKTELSDLKSNNADDIVDSSDSILYHLRKWKKHRSHYSDGYLELFNETDRNASSVDHPYGFGPSQVGSVRWNSDEKNRLFAAIARFGQHDLSKLSTTVMTKSPVEIAVYLDTIRAAMIDRQLFQENAKNVSLSQIPAAIEVGPECENALEKAADALSSYQEQYDIASGLNDGGSSWLIDRAVAERMDVEYADTDADQDKAGEWQNAESNLNPKNIGDSLGNRLFKLSTMLDLSEEIFMNQPVQSRLPHWEKIALPGQRPAMTADTLQTLVDLVKDRLRQILTVSIQCATARISTTAGGYSPSPNLKQSDVLTALDVLNMSPDSWDFWTELPRRHQFQVITGSHSKGESRNQVISLQDAEAALAPRRGRGSKRSMSIGSEASSLQDESAPNTEEPLLPESDDTDHARSLEDDNNESSSDESNASLDSRVHRESPSVESIDSNVFDTTGNNTAIGGEERRVWLEHATDVYTESIDQKARVEEEGRLWHTLGKRSSDVFEGDSKEGLGPRPKTLRKTREELEAWSCTYMAEWEYFGHKFPAEEMVVEQADFDTDHDLLSDGRAG